MSSTQEITGALKLSMAFMLDNDNLAKFAQYIVSPKPHKPGIFPFKGWDVSTFDTFGIRETRNKVQNSEIKGHREWRLSGALNVHISQVEDPTSETPTLRMLIV